MLSDMKSAMRNLPPLPPSTGGLIPALRLKANTKTFSKDWVGINVFLSQNCLVGPGVSPKSIYIKFVEVERDFLSAGSLVECLEKAIGYPLKFNN